MQQLMKNLFNESIALLKKTKRRPLLSQKREFAHGQLIILQAERVMFGIHQVMIL